MDRADILGTVADVRSSWEHTGPRSITLTAGTIAVALAIAAIALTDSAPPSTAVPTSRSAASAPVTAPAAITYGRGRQLATLADKQIDESSGIARSWLNPGVFWTHNDSGAPGRLYAFDTAGKGLATMQISGVRPRDWEDVCSFADGEAGMLLIADVGDNDRQRAEYAIHAVREPLLRPGHRGVVGSLKLVRTVRFRYADGPSNCEAIAFDPTDRTVYLLTKALTRTAKLYSFRWPRADPPKPLVLKPLATLALPSVTAMDISPDGRRAVALSYANAYEFTRSVGETWPQAFARPPRELKMPFRRQGESICYGPDGRTLYLTSEQLPAPLLAVPPVGSADVRNSAVSERFNQGKGPASRNAGRI